MTPSGKGIVDETEAKISIAKLRTKLDAATGRLAEIERKLSTSQIVDVPKIVASVVKLFRSVKFQPAEHRRKLIRSLIQEIRIGGDQEIQGVRLRVGVAQTLVLDTSPGEAA